eukprot:TRINITY_DN44719_c0_g1_i1.p1 TRINITY_DN44719_c0_g1~~TRINITY_DN44719_c0_g1_i1.p1  ORF type:complete len:429 (-),score=41.40 TRINITY_DN44719_c0_g1_i1:113-1399(-)
MPLSTLCLVGFFLGALSVDDVFGGDVPVLSHPGPYHILGSVDVGTDENSIFAWGDKLFLLENIPCSYLDHAGQWFPRFANHSYARIRDAYTGVVVINISTSIGFGFISAFVDADLGRGPRLWLFGVPVDRCRGTYAATTVFAWWSDGDADDSGVITPAVRNSHGGVLFSDLNDLTHRQEIISGIPTYNVEVAAVGRRRVSAGVHTQSSALALPPHRYVMILEPFTFLVADAADGNLSATGAWRRVSSTNPPAPPGGPSIRWIAAEHADATEEAAESTSLGATGHYYVITGGHHVHLCRSADLSVWDGCVEFVSPTPGDAVAATRFAGFTRAEQERKGFYPAMMEHWDAWDWNSNDADVCCAEVIGHGAAANGSYVVWGASTQGKTPLPPVLPNTSSTNVIGWSPFPLGEMLSRVFENGLQRQRDMRLR